MKKTKKQEDELFAINIAGGMIGIFLIFIGVFNLLGFGMTDLGLFMILFGIFLIIYKLILIVKSKGKLKWNQ